MQNSNVKDLARSGYSEEAQAIDADPDNDFPEITEAMLSTAKRGLFAGSLETGSNVVAIDEDLYSIFFSEKAVNDALRTLLPLVHSGPIPRIEECFPVHDRARLQDYEQPKRTVVIHDDVTVIFRTPHEVNQALRTIAELVHQVESRRAS